MKFSPQQLFILLPSSPSPKTLWIAYSGGLDSTCLLHAIAILNQQGRLNSAICAIHIHHGLSQNADAWQKQCAEFSSMMMVDFKSIQVDAQPRSGQSPEAVARDARYQAIAKCMKKGDVLLTGHHQDDQAETLLIQLLRGSGVQGLAAMPVSNTFEQGLLHRPLLQFSRKELQTYAEQQSLSWVEDESNQCNDYDRNLLRNQIIPQLQQRWPSMNRTLSRTAAHCAESAQLCDELAIDDLQDISLADPFTLPVEGLLALSRARQNNLLRYWVVKQKIPLPTTAQLQQITHSLLSAKKDATPLVCWQGGELRRFSANIYLMPPLEPHDAKQILSWPLSTEILDIPSLGLTLQRNELKQTLNLSLQVKFRQGGERYRRPDSIHHTTLKKLFQSHQVPPWQRNRIPLLYHNGELLEVYQLLESS